MLQAVGVGTARSLLGRWVPLDEDAYDISINRATATLGHPIAYGDLVIYAAVISAALALRCTRYRRLRWSLTGVLCLGALASGQASALLGLAVAGVVFGLITRTARKVALAGLGLTAAVVLEPVLIARVRALESGSGLPTSLVGVGRRAVCRLPSRGANGCTSRAVHLGGLERRPPVAAERPAAAVRRSAHRHPAVWDH